MITESDIRKAFELFAETDLLPAQKSEILRRAIECRTDDAVCPNAKKLVFCGLSAFASAAVIACAIIAALGQKPDTCEVEPYNGFGSIVVDSSNRKKLILRDGAFLIHSDAEYEWDRQTELAIVAAKAARYFYDIDESHIVIIYSKPNTIPLSPD